MSLTSCLKKSKDYLHPDDRAAVLRVTRNLRNEGRPSREAALGAVDRQLVAVRTMLEAATYATLSSQTRSDLKAKTERESRADELDAKAQIDAERGGFSLQSQSVERRADNTGDMFGGPSPEEVLAARKPGKAAPVNEDQASLFARATGDVAPQVARVQRLADAITAGWKNAPPIKVLASMDDAPAAVRRAADAQAQRGADGSPSAFFHAGGVFLVANKLQGGREVAEALFHESLGHFGLRGAFGTSLDGVLRQMAVAHEADVRAKAKEYGLDYANRAERLTAAEEVLAALAQTKPENTWVQKAIAAIRTWLRENIAAFRNLELSDAEIIRSFIAPARDFVTRGKPIPASPLSGDYKQLEGKKLTLPVRLADSGKVVQVTVDAAKELRDLDSRESTFRKLIECLA